MINRILKVVWGPPWTAICAMFAGRCRAVLDASRHLPDELKVAPDYRRARRTAAAAQV